LIYIFNELLCFKRNADAIILVYDRTEASSFQNISRWMRNIDENAPDDVVRILVGNKTDLHDRLVVSTHEGKLLADKFHVDFFETSAKSDTSPTVSKMFYFLTEKLLDQKQETASREQQLSSAHQTGNINLTNNQSESTYGKLLGCCSSTRTVDD
jgi:Ras-related protein Rab-8A